MGENIPVMFRRGDDHYTGWTLKLKAPDYYRAVIGSPDSSGWSLDVDESQNTATIGCETSRDHAMVTWMGQPDSEAPFPTLIEGTLHRCSDGGPGGSSPDFSIEILGGQFQIVPDKEYATIKELIKLQSFFVHESGSGMVTSPVNVQWSANSTDITFKNENGEVIEQPDDYHEIWISSNAPDFYEIHGSHNDEIYSTEICFFEIIFIEDEETVYNFSPTMGEIAELKVELNPEIDFNELNRIPDVGFNIEIIREPKDGDDQTVDFVNVNENAPSSWSKNGDIDFDYRLIDWDGVPYMGADYQTLPAIQGEREFEGVNDSFNMFLPEVSKNNPVPPPLYTAKVNIFRVETGLPVVYDNTEDVFVPQVYLLKYKDQKSIDAVTDNFVIEWEWDEEYEDFHLYSGEEFEGQFDHFKSWKIQKIRNAFDGVNIRFTYSQNLTGSNYSIVSFDKGADWAEVLGVFEGSNFGNENPNVEVRVFNPAIRVMLVDLFEDLIYTNGDNPEYPEVPQPYVKINHMANAVAFVAIHEVGHGLGLVADNDILDGSSHSHNKPPFPNEVNIMDPGPRRDPDFYYFVDTWSWRETNFKYLEFILPTQ